MATTTRSTALLFWAVALLMVALPPMWMVLTLTVTGSTPPGGMPAWAWLLWIVPALPLMLSAGLAAEAWRERRGLERRMSH